MRFRYVAVPATERLGDFKAVVAVHYGWPAFGETLSELAYEHIAHKSRDLPTLLRFGTQPTQHLHSGDIVFAKLGGQKIEGDGRPCLGEGGERVVPALTDAFIQADPPVSLPGTSIGHRLLPEVKFIGMS
jgi:hypothetical protein